MSFYSKLSRVMIKMLLVVGGVALIVMMTIVVGNCLGRALFRKPIYGTIEIVGLAGVVVAAVAAGFAQRERRNVVIDVVVNRFTPRFRALANAFTLFLSLGTVAFLFWAILNNALDSLTNREATLILDVFTAPFKFSWAIGVIILCLFLLQHMIEAIRRWRKR